MAGQIATAVNQMSTLFTGLGQQLPEMLQGIDQLKAGSDQLTTEINLSRVDMKALQKQAQNR